MGASCTPNDAVRLLLAINAPQAHGRVGSIVFPFTAARPGGFMPGGPVFTPRPRHGRRQTDAKDRSQP